MARVVSRSSTSFCSVVLATILYVGLIISQAAQVNGNVCYKLLTNVECPEFKVEPSCLPTCKQLCGVSSNATCVDNVEYPQPKCACEFSTNDDCTKQRVC